MGYSLGDDKESFDVFAETVQMCNDLAREMEKRGWTWNEDKYGLQKEERILKMEVLQDHITDIFITDDSIDYDAFCDKNQRYDPIYGNKDIEGINTYVTKNTNIKQIANDLEFAPLKYLKEESYEI